MEQYKPRFSSWYLLDEQNIDKAPNLPGDYVFRMSNGQSIPRLKGQSDIAYIGSTKRKGELKRRLRDYLHPSPDVATEMRIHEMAKKYKMEVSWCACDEPDNLEHQLIQQYELDHDELPPLNHAKPRQLVKELFETILLSDSIQLTK